MTEDEKQELLTVIRDTIQTKVNGKIDLLHVKLDSHMVRHEEDMTEVRAHIKEVVPYLEGARGVKVLSEFAKWAVGLGVIWLAIKGLLIMK